VRENLRLPAFKRALRGQCPRCQSTDLFADRFRLHPACPGCGLPFEQEDGWSLGAIPLNYTLTCLGWVLPCGLLVLPGWLSVKTACILGGIGVFILPWLTYRYSKKVWLGTYYAILPHEMRHREGKPQGDIH